MLDYIRVTSAIPDVSVADTDYNTQEIFSKIQDADAEGSDVIVFPELAITGYSCGDLFFQKTLLTKTIESLSSVIMSSRRFKSVIVVGAPIRLAGQLYNCACVIEGGKLLGIVPKTFIPNTSEMYEKRWFSSASQLTVNSVKASELDIFYVSDYDIPVGSDLIFNINNEVNFGVEIGEDLLAPIPPSTLLALGGAQLILNLSAGSEIVSGREYRRELVKQQSARNICAYVYASAGAGESTTDCVFGGAALICEDGSIIKENSKLIDNDYILTADVDMGKIDSERLRAKSFSDCASLYVGGDDFRIVSISSGKLLAEETLNAAVRKLPFVPDTKQERLVRCMEIFEIQVAGLKKRIQITNAKPVVGVSGGLDSTLALLVSVQAMKELNRPVRDVVGITMPCFGTTDRTYNNSLKLMETLGVTFKEIDIKDACVVHAADIGHDLDNHNTTFENMQARERTQVLMDYAGDIGGFVVGTGDLSELALGWCTYNADHMSMYGVNAGIPKTLIRWMVASIAEHEAFSASAEVLRDIVDTPISPELLPPDETGKIAQKTEDLVGPYSLHDFFIYYMLRYNYSPSKIYQLACIAFADDFDSEVILKWLKTFYRRFFTQQFKRNCMPDGVKVGSVGISPRGDLRMPSDASSAIWMEEAESLEPVQY